MQREQARNFVVELYKIAFNRAPSDAEFDMYLPQLVDDTLSPGRLVELFRTSAEFCSKGGVSSMFPAGHYHSPVVDPGTVRWYVDRERQSALNGFAGIALEPERMRSLWLKHLPFLQQNPLGAEPRGNERFGYSTGPFPEGDAISLQMMLAECRPKHVVEIGSGHSTACLLDGVDSLGLAGLKLTCIEPLPQRLRSLLRDHDEVAIIDRPVQQIDPSIVDVLGENDFLFIDSTHVMKTGSDVHYEFFHLLPRLRPGVVVHLHDVGFPFEYPDEWIDQNYSWNEMYALRAFLMYNDSFQVFYWASLMRTLFTQQMHLELPLKSGNPGSSMWLRKVA